MTRVVLDTNVIVSALLKPDSNPETILNLLLEHKAFTLYVTDEIIQEYRDVLAYKKFNKHFDQGKVRAFLEALIQSSRKPRTVPAIPSLLDEDETKFLACAVGAKAGFLVTGNTKDFPKGSYKGVAIVTPTEFLHRLGNTFLSL